MTRRPWIPERVESCTPTRDGNFLILTRTHKTAISPVPLTEGAEVTIRADNTAVPRKPPAGIRDTSQPVEPVLRSLEAIDRIRGRE